MSSDWQRLADHWYRKRDIYTALWNDEPERLHVSVVAGAPFGGPVATVRDERQLQAVRGSLRPELLTWTSAGRLIASVPWVHTGLLTMGWSSQETLICVFDTGVVRTFSVMCEPLDVFTVDGRIESEGGAIQASLWGGGLVLLTKRLNLYINASLVQSRDACHRCTQLASAMKSGKPPISMCVLPPDTEGSTDVQVIVGTQEEPKPVVYVVDKQSAQPIADLDDGPYSAFAVSSNGRLLACLSNKGLFKVLAIRDGFRVADATNIESKQIPHQMVWCGNDCIALYLKFATPSGGLQHVLFVGGPQNDWLPYQYDAPLHLVSENDGVRILGTHKVEFIQAVPPATDAIYSVGNCDPPAMLCYAHERFESGDVCAQESLRVIKDDLGDARATCIEAASVEHEDDKVEPLLNAAVFGRHFLAEPPDPKPFIATCQNLRICCEIRKEPIDIPITLPQLAELGIGGLVTRLAQRRHHFLAVRICEWVGHSCEDVLFHWACQKIKQKKGAGLTDEELYRAILDKFAARPGVGYAEVARVAAETYRPHLATMLLNHEPRGHAQVQILLQLSRESDEENRIVMLRFAAEKAVQSGDPDLLYSVICCACGGDPSKQEVVLQSLTQLLGERQSDLQMVGDVFAAALQRHCYFDRLRTFHEQLSSYRRAAHCAVMQVFTKRDAEERMKWLRFAKDFFGQGDPSAGEAEKSSMQFCGQACTEEAELLKLQIALEHESDAKRWMNGPYKFAGLSLVDTLRKLIQAGEVLEADKLRNGRISDKHYWRIKVRALSDAADISGLEDLVKIRTSPIGYELFVEAFLRHGRTEHAMPLIPKIKSLEAQADFYSKMGLEEKANEIRSQSGQRSGAGRLLQNLGLRLG